MSETIEKQYYCYDCDKYFDKEEISASVGKDYACPKCGERLDDMKEVNKWKQLKS